MFLTLFLHLTLRSVLLKFTYRHCVAVRLCVGDGTYAPVFKSRNWIHEPTPMRLLHCPSRAKRGTGT
ncbi:hypothetical protein M758_7G175700 [Ceratodon purpureus]|uniref:Secreted protein n=1 Tax=Ceratodon purpureus TaxID=3225 RepID=A0A8T0H7U5_CERPU|nr:hypothetical protein KC19_7G178600 [Ceratodon purpureus]KAG0611912.1 hypothetical protein M758_7G175700 [Ceratodon purpureus]